MEPLTSLITDYGWEPLCIWKSALQLKSIPNFSRFGTDFGTRDMGAKIRSELLALLNANKRVVLDFTGVNVVSNSFADECIAKLLFDIPLNELKKLITFCGLSQMAERSILVALQRRYKVLKQQIM